MKKLLNSDGFCTNLSDLLRCNAQGVRLTRKPQIRTNYAEFILSYKLNPDFQNSAVLCKSWRTRKGATFIGSDRSEFVRICSRSSLFLIFKKVKNEIFK